MYFIFLLYILVFFMSWFDTFILLSGFSLVKFEFIFFGMFVFGDFGVFVFFIIWFGGVEVRFNLLKY